GGKSGNPGRNPSGRAADVVRPPYGAVVMPPREGGARAPGMVILMAPAPADPALAPPYVQSRIVLDQAGHVYTLPDEHAWPTPAALRRPGIRKSDVRSFEPDDRADDGRPPDDRRAPASETVETPAREADRALLPDPGVSRVLRWGAFKDVLRSQLAHPERLRDTHHLPCHVQAYEVMEAQRLEPLAAAIAGDAGAAGQFLLLTQDVARAL